LNPFGPDQRELVSLSAATAAPEEVARDILDAHGIGRISEYEKFKKERLEAIASSTQFQDRIQKKKLKTFSDIRKKIMQPRTCQRSFSES